MLISIMGHLFAIDNAKAKDEATEFIYSSEFKVMSTPHYVQLYYPTHTMQLKASTGRSTSCLSSLSESFRICEASLTKSLCKPGNICLIKYDNYSRNL